MTTTDSRSVCHVLRKYQPAQWGGTESHIAAVTAEQARQGWSVEVMAPHAAGFERGPIDSAVGLEPYWSFLPFVGTSSRRQEAVRHAGNIASVDLPLRVARKRPSVLHLHTGRRIGGAATLAARTLRIPYVMSLHGPVAADKDWMAAETSKRYRGLVDVGKPIGWLVGARRVLDRAARVICFNDNEYEAISQLLPKGRAVRMSHGVDVSRFAAGDADRFFARHPRLRGRTVIACVGRLSRQKNQVRATHAFGLARIPNSVLVLAGSESDSGYADEIRSVARSHGCLDNVVLLGNVSPTEVPDLLAASLIALVPSSQEAFGLTAIEAWAAGRPALCAMTAGLRPLAKRIEDKRFFLEDCDYHEWGRALSKLASSPERLERCGADSQQFVAKELSWAARTAELLQLYREVITEAQA
jgi:glycosyltransferase involved in cell wall biosynthesis